MSVSFFSSLYELWFFNLFMTMRTIFSQPPMLNDGIDWDWLYGKEMNCVVYTSYMNQYLEEHKHQEEVKCSSRWMWWSYAEKVCACVLCIDVSMKNYPTKFNFKNSLCFHLYRFAWCIFKNKNEKCAEFALKMNKTHLAVIVFLTKIKCVYVLLSAWIVYWKVC